MNVHRFGTSHGSSGLWLHGWMGSGLEGKFLSDVLQKGLICPDLPGHGDTPLEGWTRDRVLEQIAELASSADWVAGYSMGARLLMMAAMRYPDAFDTMILESGSLGYATPEERSHRVQLDSERADDLERRGLEAFCRDWYSLPMWGDMPSPRREGDPSGLAGALRLFSTGKQPDAHLWIRSTTCRVLWLAGSQDSSYAEQAEWVRRHTRHQVQILTTGHNVHYTDPEQWSDPVHDFLETRNEQKEQ